MLSRSCDACTLLCCCMIRIKTGKQSMQGAKRQSLYKILLALLTIVALSMLWRWAIDHGWMDQAQLTDWLSQWQQQPYWLLGIYLTALYVVLLQLFFPLTILVVVTGALFGPFWGSVFASLGTLSSSALCYWVGLAVGEAPLRRLQGRLIKRASSYMSQRSVRTMIIINLLPIAPFTLTNLLAGAVKMPFMRYMLGSAIGIVPGLIAVTVFGAQLTQLATAASKREWLVALGTGVLALAALWLLNFYVRQRRAPPSPQHKTD
ncbi:phospholipase [Aliidiomarina soli]|uniref:TVP38/TMEM64 family membrane protein n=2 Tax=Aliidiomarina soli TaxID=1928574 RepID=A0A432WF10_9GAMM|nr:phospholipase [Aliidiomarina soli]